MKIRFSATEHSKYVAKMNANDYTGTYALHRVKGLLPKEDSISPDVLKFLSKKPEVVLVFPDVKSIENIIDGLINLRTMMLEKKGIAEEQEVPDLLEHLMRNAGAGIKIRQLSPEEVIQKIRSEQREEKGRVPKNLRPLMRSLSKLENLIGNFIKKNDPAQQEEVKEEENKHAEPA